MSELTDEMRTFLGAEWSDKLLYDIALEFKQSFDLTTLNTGALIAQWVWETL